MFDLLKEHLYLFAKILAMSLENKIALKEHLYLFAKYLAMYLENKIAPTIFSFDFFKMLISPLSLLFITASK